MPSQDVVISLQDVSMSYAVREGFFRWSKHIPLKKVSFDLHRGETIGVIGSNGAGKSTLLKLIAGIIEPDNGQILNNGVRISLLSLGVGFMPHLSGRQNAILSGILLGLRKKQIEQKIDAIRDFADIGDFFDQPLQTYSSGMRARLAFSVAIQIDPDVLLIDEVLGVGDQEFRAKSNKEIRRLIMSDKTVVLVTHILPVLKELASKIVWIDKGVVKEFDETEIVLKHYTR